MSESFVKIMLLVTGAITASMIFQFLAPRFVLKTLNKMQLEDEVGLFFARHWGMVVFGFGLLIIWAAYEPALRLPVLAIATFEKLCLVLMIALNWQVAKGMFLAMLFDIGCVVLYSIYLAQNL